MDVVVVVVVIVVVLVVVVVSMRSLLVLIYSSNRQLPLLSMDQTEFQRRLEEKVAEMVAPPVESSPWKASSETTFLASDVFGRYMARDEADQSNCDSCSKVHKICVLHMFCYIF